MTFQIYYLVEYTEEPGMKEAMSSHDLKGLSLISDYYMICGAAVFGVSLLLLFTGSFVALIAIGYGVIIIAVGHYLDDLHPAAWWFAVLSNLVPLASYLYNFLVNYNLTMGITFILNLALAILIIGYLLKPKVRNHFFVESEN
ncbi:MAG: hypothetical protein ThorAB25_14810 [Candidatus Thorarchaeota archaeon AB_25]|nr:MAG: hypothetical protein ThorAB25_14810 [Candidatus Thorarchaeota archaeon AB_25]